MLKYFADTLVYQVMNIRAGTMLGEALDFFFYDTMKVFFLLVVIIFGVAIIRSFFPLNVHANYLVIGGSMREISWPLA